MDAAAKRKITVGVKRLLQTADLDRTTMRDIFRGLVDANAMSDTHECRKYARAAVRRALGVPPDERRVRVKLRVAKNGHVGLALRAT